MNINAINFLIVEILACLAIAALLGLLIGWMMRRAIAKKQARRAERKAKARYKELERSSFQDCQNLEDQLQALGTELKSVKNNNQNLNVSLRDTENSINQARNESIELNQAQLETNERLQSIIRDKDREIKRLMQLTSANSPNLVPAAGDMGASSSLVSRVTNRTSAEPNMDSNETLDATTVLNGPLHQTRTSDHRNEESLAVLNEGTNQLRNERRALLDSLTDGEETVAIDAHDLPLDLQAAARAADSDNMDKTINLDQDIENSTELGDTLETP